MLRPPRVQKNNKGSLYFLGNGGEEVKIKGSQDQREAQQDLIRSKIMIGVGKVKTKKKGLFGHEIDKILKSSLGSYRGVIAADEISKLNLPKDQVSSFMMNLDTSDEPGSHWIGIRLDPVEDRSIEVYDPLALFPDSRSVEGQSFLKDIGKVVEDFNLPYLLKTKINMVRNQSNKTTTCGFHSMRFLLARENGLSFSQASLYDENKVQEGEKKVGVLKKNLVKWGFL